MTHEGLQKIKPVYPTIGSPTACPKKSGKVIKLFNKRPAKFPDVPVKEQTLQYPNIAPTVSPPAPGGSYTVPVHLSSHDPRTFMDTPQTAIQQQCSEQDTGQPAQKILGLSRIPAAPGSDHRIGPCRERHARDHGNRGREVTLLPAARPCTSAASPWLSRRSSRS